jgi:feruloyl esterase
MPNLFGGGSSGWMNMIVSEQPNGKPADFGLAEDTMRYLVHKPPKPDYDYKTFDYDRDIHMLDEWSKLADAKNPDLSGFKKRGGKLLMTYGWADSILQPMMGVNYYEQTVAKNGPDTADFFRLFMVPGMSHCSGGTGPDQHDPMTVIINWVEKEGAMRFGQPNGRKGSAHAAIVSVSAGCYSGQGNDDAANFRCVALKNLIGFTRIFTDSKSVRPAVQ